MVKISLLKSAKYIPKIAHHSNLGPSLDSTIFDIVLTVLDQGSELSDEQFLPFGPMLDWESLTAMLFKTVPIGE